MFSVTVSPGETLTAWRPKFLFDAGMPTSGGGLRPYDLATDGRFVMIRSGQAESSTLIMVQHWFDELKRKMSSN
jgi:hypothetical protein